MDEKIYICEQCHKPLPNGETEICSHCGAMQENGGILLTKIPETIEELKAFCENKGMPLERMRFFIGEDFREPKAFGIYRQENGDVVVYKNKADGSRSIRYEGPDEARGVKELYEKLKSEVELRRSAGDGKQVVGTVKHPRLLVRALCVAILVFIIAVGTYSTYRAITRTNLRGYYRYGGREYYYLDRWYHYDSYLDGWYESAHVPEELEASPKDYFESRFYDTSGNYRDFSETSYYDDYEWDSGSSSYDSWDSGGTDWDSDW